MSDVLFIWLLLELEDGNSEAACAGRFASDLAFCFQETSADIRWECLSFLLYAKLMLPSHGDFAGKWCNGNRNMTAVDFKRDNYEIRCLHVLALA